MLKKTVWTSKVFIILLWLYDIYVFMSKSSNINSMHNLSCSRSHLKDSITDFSMDLFKKRGIKEVTMDEIASSMGISKRTLYEVFETKEDLLVYGLKRKRDEDESLMAEIVAQNLNLLDMTLRRFKHVVNEHKSICLQFFLDIKKFPKVVATIDEFKKKDKEYAIEYYNRGIREGFFRDDLNYDVLELILNNMFNFLFSSDIFLRYDIETVYKTIMFCYIRGIATPKGQEILEKFVNEYNGKI